MEPATKYFQFKWAELQQKHDESKLQLVNVELDLAITYCLIAMGATDEAKFHRNIANAEQAYSAAAYFLDRRLIASQHEEIKTKLNRFRTLRMICDGGAQTQ